MRPEQQFCTEGRFEMDGVGLEQMLVAGTPGYVYSASAIRDQYAKLAGALAGCTVCYSLKANPNPDVCRLIAGLGSGAEVSSLKELQTALASGFHPDKVVLVGPAKTDEELELAVRTGILAIVADSAAELELVERLAQQAGAKPRVLLRINTSERLTAWEQMTGGPSKFGFDEEKVADDVRPVKLKQARIAGVQVYSASGVLAAAELCRHLEYVIQMARRLAGELGFDLEMIDFGGGFGIPYAEEESDLDLSPVGATARKLKAENPDVGFVFESGRFIVGPAGVFLTRVRRVKESRGRTFVICDGGMNSFSRPVVMRLSHPVRLVNRLAEPADGEFDVCGPICTPIDVSARGVRLPRPEPGDVVGFFSAGAYGHSMSLQGFMSRGRPAELLTDAGQVKMISE